MTRAEQIYFAVWLVFAIGFYLGYSFAKERAAYKIGKKYIANEVEYYRQRADDAVKYGHDPALDLQQMRWNQQRLKSWLDCTSQGTEIEKQESKSA